MQTCDQSYSLTWQILADANIGTLRWNLSEGMIEINQAASSMLDIPEHVNIVSASHLYHCIYPEDRLKVRQSVENFINLSTSDSLEIHFRGKSTTHGLRKLSCIMRAQGVFGAGSPTHLIGILSDHTELELARTETLKKTQLEELIINVSINLMRASLDSIDEVITNALRDTSTFVGADRAYRIDYDWKNAICSNTHEWCAAGIKPEIDNLQNVPVSEIPLWTSSHRKGLPFIVSSVSALPAGHPLREILEPQNIKSLVTLPIKNADECMGFIGFDSVRSPRHYSLVEISLLELLAQLIANAEVRRRREKELLDTLAQLEESRLSALTMANIARSASEAKSRFLATMSHEIRTPLHAVLGLSELLEDQLTSPQQRDLIDAIRAAGKTLTELIGDILDISRIESGNAVLEKRNFFLQELIEEAKSVVNSAQKATDTVVRICDAPAISVNQDKAKIRQILMNLLSNAIKFTPTGEVVLEVYLSGHQESNSSTLNIKVSDTGIGMSREVLKRIHEPFYQASRNLASSAHGTGLGLPIVFNLVDLMSGSISIESEPERGSCFWVRIPVEVAKTHPIDGVARLKEEPSPADEDHKPNLRSVRILIAEDNPMNQMLIKAHLTKESADTTFVENGSQALEQVIQGEFDIILMDCQMPVMDGFEATRLIRQHLNSTGNRQTPIIAVTANAVEGDLERCIAAGMNAMLKKPFNRKQLLGVLGSWLES